MEGPLLTKNEHILDDVTIIHGDSSSNEEHIVNITTNVDSSSDDEQTQDDCGDHLRRIIALFVDEGCDGFTSSHVWVMVEFVLTLLQVVAAIAVLTLTKDETDPQKVFRTLIICYTGGCIVVLLILGLDFWDYCGRYYEVMENLKKMLDYFFVGWVVVFSWHLINNSSSPDNTTQQFWLCMAFLVVSCILHVLPNLPCAAACFLYPMILRLTQSIDFFDDITEKIEDINWLIFVYFFGIFSCIICCIFTCCSRLCR